jgi:hypothetical protein
MYQLVSIVSRGSNRGRFATGRARAGLAASEPGVLGSAVPSVVPTRSKGEHVYIGIGTLIVIIIIVLLIAR